MVRKLDLNTFFNQDKITIFLLFLIFGFVGFSRTLATIFTSILTVFIVVINFKKINKEFFRLTFACFALFIVYLLGFFYTNNVALTYKLVIRSLPILMFPILFYFIKVDFQLYKRIIITYCISVCIAIFWSLIMGLIYFSEHRDEYYFEYAQNKIPAFIRFHAPYFSAYIFVGVFLLINLGKKISSKIRLPLLIVFALYLLFLSSRMPLFAGISLLIAHYIYTKIVSRKFSFWELLIPIIFILLFLINPYLQTKISHIFEKGYGVDFRAQANFISFQLFLQRPILGYSLGDFQQVFEQALEFYQLDYVKEKLNPHNQYTFLLLATGLVGLFTYLWHFYLNIRKALKIKNIAYLQILIFFLIIGYTEVYLLRQDGIMLWYLFLNFFYFSIPKFQLFDKKS